LSYVPGLIAKSGVTITKVRELPLVGAATVEVGARVKAQETVLTAEVPGELIVIKLAEQLGCTPNDALRFLAVKEGDAIKSGQLLATYRYFFGFFSDTSTAPFSGTIEYILESTAHLGLRLPAEKLEVPAYVTGVVTKIEEGRRVHIDCIGTFVQGIFGVGGERLGEILVLKNSREKTIGVNELQALDSLQNKIIIGGSSFALDAVQYAMENGATGIVTGSITTEVLTKIINKPLGVSLTGDEDLPLSLIITEGFGELPISRRTFELLEALDGSEASINGATQVRAGAMRPEIIVATDKTNSAPAELPHFDIGAEVRCIRAPYFGMLGTIAELPHAPEEIESGAVLRVARVKLTAGKVVTIPRANLEMFA